MSIFYTMNISIIISYILIVVFIWVWGFLLTGRSKISPTVTECATQFGGAFLLAICFLDLIPDSFGETENVKMVAICAMAGIIAQIVLEYLTHGMEHGHDHTKNNTCEVHDHQIPLVGLMLGLCMHAFFEGWPLVETNEAGLLTVNQELATGIILHNIPISIILLSFFMEKRFSVMKSLMLLTLFAVMTPLGSLLSIAVLSDATPLIRECATAFVIGILLHVAQSLMFDHHDHRFSWRNLAIILAAFAIATLL